jgi:hypothetical protein
MAGMAHTKTSTAWSPFRTPALVAPPVQCLSVSWNVTQCRRLARYIPNSTHAACTAEVPAVRMGSAISVYAPKNTTRMH